MTTAHKPSPAEHAEHAPPDAWDAIAAGYAKYVAPGEQRASAVALDLVGLKANEKFLDVAAGPGGLGLAAARLGATVLATDWAPAMVAQFAARAQAEQLTNARARPPTSTGCRSRRGWSSRSPIPTCCASVSSPQASETFR